MNVDLLNKIGSSDSPEELREVMRQSLGALVSASGSLWDLLSLEDMGRLERLTALPKPRKARGTAHVHTLQHQGVTGHAIPIAHDIHLVFGPAWVAGINPYAHNAHRQVPQTGVSSVTVGVGELAVAVRRRNPFKKFCEWDVYFV